MPRLRQTLQLCSLITVSAVVAGCASVASVPAGTPYLQVVEKFGNPAVSCPAANGGTRMIWTQEPAGEQVWATTVGSDKLTGPFTQLMQKPEFSVLREGEWTAGKVRCEFGPPANMEVYGDNQNQIVWQYRYQGVDASYMMLFVTFDRATNQMVNYSTGPDPSRNLSVIGGR
jgi:hypothetical protein